MATLTYYQHPYVPRPETSFQSHGVMDAQYHHDAFYLSTVDPASHGTATDYALFAQDVSHSQQESLQLHSSSFRPVHQPSSISVHSNFDYDQHPSSFHYSESQESSYSVPLVPLGSNFSEESGDLIWNSGSEQMLPELGVPQTRTFQFAPLPSNSHTSQQSVWTPDSSFVSSATPNSDIQPPQQSIAMKELEFESPDSISDQVYLENRLGSVHIQFSAQPTPEELDLAESIDGFTPSCHNGMIPPHILDISEDGILSAEHSPRSEPDYSHIYGHRTPASAPVRNMLGASHTRTSSTTSIRSGRGCPPNQSILDTHSRVHKGRSSKGASPSRTNAKDKSRLKCSNPKLGIIERSRVDKHAKFFPCTFHLFGCPSTFGNKNEWKRHVYSQHLQLCFYRCDIGDCNPEFNPKLYVPADKPRGGFIRHETREFGDDEDKDVIFNDFNRKDLFTQHCRRMHGPLRYATENTTMTNKIINSRVQQRQQSSSIAGSSKSKTKAAVTKEDEAAFEVELEDIRARCRTLRRKAPARTSCGFCGETFQVDAVHAASGVSPSLQEEGKAEERAWEDRMEHIGRHYERDGYPAHREAIDEDLVEWGLSVGMLETVMDHDGVSRPWLVGCEFRGLPIHGEDCDGHSTKITGMRPSSEQKRAGLRCKKAAMSPYPRLQAMSSDSDEDASAEDD